MAHAPLKTIADDYYELQSLRHIDAHFEWQRRRWPSITGTVPTLVACMELILLNCCELMRRQITILDLRSSGGHKSGGSSLDYFDHLHWHRELLWMAVEIKLVAMVVREISNEPLNTMPPTSALRHYVAARVKIDPRLIQVIRDNDGAGFWRATMSSSSTDASAVALHNLKLIGSYFSTVLDGYTCLGAHLWRDFEATSLEAAVDDPIVVNYAETALSQFRVLHQLPELLARQGNLIIDEVLDGCVLTASDLILHLRDLALLSSLMVKCLHPLAELMTTGRYYLIRENLGATSGSHSDAIVRKDGLFRGRMAKISSWLEGSNYQSDEEVRFWSRQFFSSAKEWRSLHMTFPRSLLGGHGTASLSHAPDAIISAASLARGAATGSAPPAGHLVVNEENGLSFALEDAQLYDLRVLDERLLKLIGSVAQTEFAYVQDRARRD